MLCELECVKEASFLKLGELDNWIGIYMEMGKYEIGVEPSEIPSLGKNTQF